MRQMERARKAFRNMPLRKKLYLCFSVLVILPVMTFSWFLLTSQQRYMTEKTNAYFADSVTQMALRMDHNLEEYENALRYIALNRQIVGTFEEKEPSYYQQYDAMKNLLEPMLMMVEQFMPQFINMGIYTDNTGWRERGSTFLYTDRIRDKEWYPALEAHRGIFWTADGDRLSAFLRMLRSSVRMPVNYTYITIDPADLTASEADPLSSHSLYLTDGETVLYSEHTGKTVWPMDSGEDGFRRRDGMNWIQVRRRLETTGWTLCVCCPYEGDYAETADTTRSLLLLAAGNLIILWLAAFMIARPLSSRISRLSQSISRAAAGDLDQKIATEDRDEIGTLTNHFDSMLGDLKEHIRINYENKLMLRETELKALQAQINPHFLYNTLSMINWMALEHDAMEISDIVCALSDFYRSVLNQGKTVTTVEGELENIRAYLRIQSCMHDDSFVTEMTVEEEILKCRMIGIVLQPIVENAIDHGLDQRTEKTGARLTITGRRDRDGLVFSVEDNGPGLTEEQFRRYISLDSNSYGLKNVHNRLQIAYGTEYGLTLDTSVREGTRILVRIPEEKGEPAGEQNHSPKNRNFGYKPEI